MFALLIKKALLESWLLLAACGSMVFLFCWVRVWIVTRFELQRFEVFLDQMRPFEQFMPMPLDQVLTYPGSLALTFDEPVLVLCVMVWSIARGSDVVSGELGRGTLEMLLAQPIGRLTLMLSHCLISTIGLVILASLAWLGMYAGIHTNNVRETIQRGISIPLPFLNWNVPLPGGSSETILVPLADRVDANMFTSSSVNLFAFGLFILSLATLMSALDRYRWRTIGVVVGVYVVQLLIFLLAKATPSTAWCGSFTFFSLYRPSGIVHELMRDPEVAWRLTHTKTAFWTTNLGPLGISLALLGMALACFTAAAWVFQRRDLPAPS